MHSDIGDLPIFHSLSLRYSEKTKFFLRAFLLLSFIFSSLLVYAQPPNDSPCSPTVINPDGGCALGDSEDANPDILDPNCGFNDEGSAIWFETTLSPGMDSLTIDLANISVSGFELVVMHIYTFDPDCNGTANLVPGGDFCGMMADATNIEVPNLTAGETYYIQIIHAAFEAGEFNICVQETGPPECPTSDSCDNAEPFIFEGVLFGCTIGCNTGAPAPGVLPGDEDCSTFDNPTAWYAVTLPTFAPPGVPEPPYSVIMTVGSNELFNLQIAVFQDCQALNPVGCDISFPGQSAGIGFNTEDYEPETFYVAISDTTGLEGAFEFCVTISQECNVESDIVVQSTSLGSPLEGPYRPGETVEFCLEVNEWNSSDFNGCNYIHGIVPEFGECWDDSSFGFAGEPANVTQPVGNNSNEGSWDWYPILNVFYNDIPGGFWPANYPVGPGWFYSRVDGEDPNCPDSNDPNCSLGDGQVCAEPAGNPGYWHVCFTLTTKLYPECDLEENMDCTLSFRSYSDGETGGRARPSCMADRPIERELSLDCCRQPFLEAIVTEASCSGDSVIIELNADLDPDVSVTWEVSENDMGATPCESDCDKVIAQQLVNLSNNDQVVTYTVTPVSTIDQCIGAPVVIDITVNPDLGVSIGTILPICQEECIDLNAIGFGGQAPYTFDWGFAMGQNQNVCLTETTEYSVTITDRNDCTATDMISIEVYDLPVLDIIENPDTEEICRNDEDYPLELTASVQGGSGVYVYLWDNNEFTESIVAPETGFYCVTVLDGVTQCSAQMCQEITVNEPPEPVFENPGPICKWQPNYCLEADPPGGEWFGEDINLTESGCFNPAFAPVGEWPICYLFTDPDTGCDSLVCIDLVITPAPIIDSIPDTLSCDFYVLPDITGEFISEDAAYFTESLGEGIRFDVGDTIFNSSLLYAFNDIGNGDCLDEDTFAVEIIMTPDPTFAAPDVICISQNASAIFLGNAPLGSVFNWDFDGASIVSGQNEGPYILSFPAAGTYTLSLQIDNGDCSSEVFEQEILVEAIITSPVVNCETTTNSIIFTWEDQPGVLEFMVSVVTGQAGTPIANGIEFQGLSENETVTIELTLISSTACPDVIEEITCVARNCPEIEIDIDPVQDICLDANTGTIQLNANITGSDGSGMGTWSGTAVTTDGIFDPQVAGISVHQLVYTFIEDECEFSESINISVLDVPSSDFEINSPICLDESTIVTYTGNAAITADYMWDFAGATILNGTGGVGPGPHELEWPDDGDKIISLTVIENNCSSEITNQTIEVFGPLEPPMVNCFTSSSTIEFVWMDIAEAFDYDVILIQGNAGVEGDNSYLVDGLNPGDSVTIQIVALSNHPCGNTTTMEIKCYAEECNLPIIDIASPADSVCIDLNSTLDLSSVFNADGSDATGEWSGPGIVDDVEGIFDPAIAGIGNHTISFTYIEDNCNSTQTLDIEVISEPTADFTALDEICLTDLLEINYIGDSPDGNFDWNFDGGSIISGDEEGPYEILFDSPGIKQISLVVEKDNCSSQIFEFQVSVVDTLGPLNIDCDEDLDQINFTWNSLAGVNEYEVYINNVLQTTQMGTEFLVSPLNQGDEVNITVVALNNGVCDDQSASAMCSANNCPVIDIDFNIDDTTICLTADSELINIDSIITGGFGNMLGVGEWSGPGVDPQSGVFDPNDPNVSIGDNVITFDYEEEGCEEQATLTITVLETPSALFDITPIICVTDTAILNYTGGAGPGATLDINAPGATIIGSFPGPYRLVWDEAGDYTVEVGASENSCDSEVLSQNVTVEPELETLDIQCITTTNSIEFIWGDIDCASEYSISIDTGLGFEFQTTQNNTTFIINDLDPNDEVTIQVEAVSECACPSSFTLETCLAQACPPIQLDLDQVDDFCLDPEQLSIQLQLDVIGSGGAGETTWISPFVDQNGNFDVQAAGVGTHIVSVEFLEDECLFDTSIEFEIFDLPEADISVENPLCVGATDGEISILAFNGDGNYNYFIDNVQQASDIIGNLSPGNYEVLVVDGNGCEYIENVSIQAPLNPNVEIDGIQFILNGTSTDLTGSHDIPQALIDSTVWLENGVVICSPDCSVITISPNETSEYCYRIYYQDCVAEECIEVRVENQRRIYVPNAFSPNEDGVNDRFGVFTGGAALYLDYIKIFDRWGEMVYYKEMEPVDDINSGWDGRLNNERITEGVYVYTAVIRFSDTETIFISGDVTVLR